MLLSRGVSINWDLEKDLKERVPNLLIHAYDHTISGRRFAREALRETFEVMRWNRRVRDVGSAWALYLRYKRFFRRDCIHFVEKVGTEPSTDATFEHMLSRIPSEARILLKMDIEGGEYCVIPSIVEGSSRIEVIAMEFHDTRRSRKLFEFQAKQICTKYEVVHLHGNNWDGIAADGLPEALEVTFLRKDLLVDKDRSRFRERRDALPIAGLDTPNKRDKADYSIRFN